MSNIILEIHSGEGGDDSKLFVHDLAAAYVKYAKKNELKTKILDTSVSHCVLKISGKIAIDIFKNESGKHTIQRVPPTETKGRRQTSVVSVAVLPLPPQKPSELLKDSEIEVITQGGHGKGGQHQNKTDSAVRMKHKETGLSVFINGRDQHANRREALSILSAKVNECKSHKKQTAYDKNRKKQLGGGSRSDKKRTYNFMKDLCVDHEFGTKCKNVRDIIGKGKFELINKE